MGDTLARWPAFFAVDLLRYLIVASIAFGVFWVWKWDALAHRRIQKRRPSNKALRREVMYSLSTAVVFATVGLATFHLVQAGVAHMYVSVDDYGWPWWFASIAIAIVIHDAYFYWTHRAMHHPWLFKRVHRVHHLSTSPSPWAAYAFGPAEALISALVFPLILLVMPMHQLAAFAFLIYMIVMNVIGHLGIELYPRWWAASRWTGWYTTSTHHNLHHRDFAGNYGLYFTVWDKLMRTERPEYQRTFAALASASRSRDMSPRTQARGEPATSGEPGAARSVRSPG
jgi:sterol desaturase/sphingolipid hydroxylase (fatty acid hydroxylase superfamily)